MVKLLDPRMANLDDDVDVGPDFDPDMESKSRNFPHSDVSSRAPKLLHQPHFNLSFLFFSPSQLKPR
jgi:hypothetical protein